MVNSATLAYETFLGAAGGVKPYTWRVVPVAGETDPRTLATWEQFELHQRDRIVERITRFVERS